jgi:hypothetical protein
MTYYKIDNFHYGLCAGIANAKEFFNVRKANLKITSILWICHRVEIDPDYSDATNAYSFPVLIWLN